MGKNSILITSIIALIMTIVYNFVKLTYFVKGILFYSLILVWISLLYAVFTDAKKRNMPTSYAALTLATGGVGGLIYYSKISKQNDALLHSDVSGISESSRKNLMIFSSFMAVIFGIAFLMTIPFSKYSDWNLPMTSTFGILLAMSIGAIFYAKKK